MILAYGQIPDAARPALSWPKNSLVGIIPQSGASVHGLLTKRRRAKYQAIAEDLAQESDQTQLGIEPDFSNVTIIDGGGDLHFREDEEILLILNCFLTVEN